MHSENSTVLDIDDARSLAGGALIARLSRCSSCTASLRSPPLQHCYMAGPTQMEMHAAPGARMTGRWMGKMPSQTRCAWSARMRLPSAPSSGAAHVQQNILHL